MVADVTQSPPDLPPGPIPTSAATAILCDLAESSLSFNAIAARHNTTTPDLALFLSRPDIQEQAQALESLIAQRTRFAALGALPIVVKAATVLVDAFLRDEKAIQQAERDEAAAALHAPDATPHPTPAASTPNAQPHTNSTAPNPSDPLAPSDLSDLSAPPNPTSAPNSTRHAGSPLPRTLSSPRLHSNISLLEHRRRNRETARRAMSLLIRLARTFPLRPDNPPRTPRTSQPTSHRAPSQAPPFTPAHDTSTPVEPLPREHQPAAQPPSPHPPAAPAPAHPSWDPRPADRPRISRAELADIIQTIEARNAAGALAAAATVAPAPAPSITPSVAPAPFFPSKRSPAQALFAAQGRPTPARPP